MSFIGNAWRGETRLWVVYWVYGILGMVLLNVLADLNKEKFHSIFLTQGLFVFAILFMIWLCVSQWRCAFNANWSIWGYLVRISLVIGLASFALTMASGGKAIWQAVFVAPSAMNAEMKSAETALQELTPEDMPLKAKCDQTLTEYAVKNNQDPQKFIAENPLALSKCIEFHRAQKAMPQ